MAVASSCACVTGRGGSWPANKGVEHMVSGSVVILPPQTSLGQRWQALNNIVLLPSVAHSLLCAVRCSFVLQIWFSAAFHTCRWYASMRVCVACMRHVATFYCSFSSDSLSFCSVAPPFPARTADIVVDYFFIFLFVFDVCHICSFYSHSHAHRRHSAHLIHFIMPQTCNTINKIPYFIVGPNAMVSVLKISGVQCRTKWREIQLRSVHICHTLWQVQRPAAGRRGSIHCSGDR